MINVLVLGITGMLGSMVFKCLSLNKKLNVLGTARDLSGFPNHNIFRLDAKDITEEYIYDLISKTNPDYIINCIGVINKYCTIDNQKGIQDAILINSLFPHKLAFALNKHSSNAKIIQIATDCVYSGNRGSYNENDIHDPVDIYGKSKSLGEVVNDNFLNIRCSIIGPELNNKYSLLEWFLARNDHDIIDGYNHHFWNGVTTLQFAQFCEKIIIGNEFNSLRKLNSVLHYCINESVSKYQLLLMFREVFIRKTGVIKIEDSKKLDRTLSSVYLKYEKRKMFDSVKELNKFILDTKYYE